MKINHHITDHISKPASTALPRIALINTRSLCFASGLFTISLMASLVNSGATSPSQQRPVNVLTFSKPSIEKATNPDSTNDAPALASPKLVQPDDASNTSSTTRTNVYSTSSRAEVTVNGEVMPVPTDGSTVTKSSTSDDGTTNNVVSITGSSNSSADVTVNSSTRSSTYITNDNDVNSHSP